MFYLLLDCFLSPAFSTASSDISDWTTEAGINLLPSRKRDRRTRRRFDIARSVCYYML